MVLREATSARGSPAALGPGTSAPTPASGSAPASPAGVARAALTALDRTTGRLDAALSAARRGATFTPGELLALQAEAYRYAQTVDVAARAVEAGAQTIRQAVHAQA